MHLFPGIVITLGYILFVRLVSNSGYPRSNGEFNGFIETIFFYRKTICGSES